MKIKHYKTCSDKNKCGSALLLAVVLTSLLAIVATLFVLASRINETTSSADVENKQLNHAADSIIQLISHQLIDDLPGPNDPNEYYDYPDDKNTWLASLEPFKDPCGIYRWQQISDVTSYLKNKGFDNQGVSVQPIDRDVIREYPEIRLDGNGNFLDVYNNLLTEGLLADADGDGIADSKWFELTKPDTDGITNSPKGKRIFAAVRIIDNSAMLNVNTAYRFGLDPNSDSEDIDGSSQTQIDLEALAALKGESIDALSSQRIGSASLSSYRDEAIWKLRNDDPCSTPFDISDELELRYRYLINSQGWTRLETAWPTVLRTDMVNYYQPYDASPGQGLEDWQTDVLNNYAEPNDSTNLRPLLTAYNIDRIIDPNLDRMVNINKSADTKNPRRIYDKLVSGLDSDMLSKMSSSEEKKLKAQYAQLAVNLTDFTDEDDQNKDGILDPNSVSVLEVNNVNYYGFEAQPFISELGIDIAGNPAQGQSYYAVELYNPFSKRIYLDDFAIVLVDRGMSPYQFIKNLDRNDDTNHFINFYSKNYYIKGTEDAGTKDGGTFVLANRVSAFRCWDETDPRFVLFSDWLLPDKSKPVEDERPTPDKRKPPVYIGWSYSYDVYLARWVKDRWILVDCQPVTLNWGPAGKEIYPYRDVRYWHIAYPTMTTAGIRGNNGSLCLPNPARPQDFEHRSHNFSFELPNPFDPNSKFVTVGDITRMLTIGNSPTQTIAEQLLYTKKEDEGSVRLDLQNPYNRKVFNYLTVFDPADHLDDPNETRIKGRININTAGWYVIAQLPWLSKRNTAPFNNTDNPDRYDLAKAIVAYRDKLDVRNIPNMPDVDYSDPDTGRYDEIKNVIDDRFDADDIREAPGFEGIAELNLVLSGQKDAQGQEERRRRIDFYAQDNQDLTDFPDLTTRLKDELVDDFEERDVIFSRISNLVTVRSDLFTAYILVRLGTDGPQKRLIAILDRSGVTKGPNGEKQGKVKINACQIVPDPR